MSFSTLVVVFVIALASKAAAQDQSPAPVVAGWRGGFVLQSDNGDYRMQLNALLQTDGRFAIDDPQNNVISTFTVRRLRPILQGRIAKVFEFYFTPDFAGGIVNIRDAYVDTRFSPALRIRVGKGKTPFGLERLQGAAYLSFVERALPTTVAPDRDIGMQAMGDLAGGVVSYQAGIFNGVADGGSAEADVNDSKDVAGRLVVRPHARHANSPLEGLGIALAGSSGVQPAALPSFRSSGLQTFFAYDQAAVGEGARHRVSPQFFYYYKSIGIFGEYVRSTGAVARGAASADIVHESLMIAGSVIVTGEAASDRGVRPKHPFDPSKHRLGALQITARYHALVVDPQVFALGFSAPGSSREARAFTLGANWHLNAFVKWVFNFERTVFDGNRSPARHAENAALLRSQISFYEGSP